MTMDTSVAQHVAWQCTYLAGPGVLINAFSVAAFLYAYIDWSSEEHAFLLSLVTGSILCATDPVAVVALLKELGASPTLTVQIQGESLLNDGSAIVLYTIAYNMLRGEEYDFADIVMFLVKVALMALALGMFVGYFFFSWIRVAGVSFNHYSTMVQIALTLCAAYWSFILAEGIFKISGVLSTVACSLVLAHHMWPHVVCQETMNNVWHTFESLGNVLIFFLAGSLTGDAMIDIEFMDYIRLLVIYLVLLLARGLLIFLSRPILRLLSAHRLPVSASDAAVMTWGGLRGAVGLALAIQVRNHRAPNVDDSGDLMVSEQDGKRVLFFVCGVALLTTVINATTAPALVRFLGLASLPEAQSQLLKLLTQQLMAWSINSGYPSEVTSSLTQLMKELQDHIDHQKHSRMSCEQVDAGMRVSILRTATNAHAAHPAEGEPRRKISQDHQHQHHFLAQPSEARSAVSTEAPTIVTDGGPISNISRARSGSTTSGAHYIDYQPSRASLTQRVSRSLPSRPSFFQRAKTQTVEEKKGLIKKLRAGEAMYRKLCDSNTDATLRTMLFIKGGTTHSCKGIPDETLLGHVDRMVEAIDDSDVDPNMAQVVNKAFLQLVNAQYWKQIEYRDLRPGSEEAKILLTSIQVALSTGNQDLLDFNFILRRLKKVSAQGAGDWWQVFPEEAADDHDFVENCVRKSDRLRNSAGELLAPEKFGPAASARSERSTFLSMNTNTTAGSFLVRCCRAIVASASFHIVMAVAIILNGVYVGVEENYGDTTGLGWLLAEASFTFLFLFEFVVKFAALSWGYFKSGPNIFDFVLVLLGIFGLIMSIVEYAAGGDSVEDLTGVIRISRVFRVLRFLRVFRLFHAKLSADKEVSVELAQHMLRLSCYMSYIGAHLSSQVSLVKYFGGLDLSVEENEICRCIIQSQVYVYRAIELTIQEEKSLDEKGLLDDLRWTLERKEITEGLEEFVMLAFKDGAITAREAHSIVHPLHHQLAECLQKINDTAEGITRTTRVDTSHSSPHGPPVSPKAPGSPKSVPASPQGGAAGSSQHSSPVSLSMDREASDYMESPVSRRRGSIVHAKNNVVEAWKDKDIAHQAQRKARPPWQAPWKAKLVVDDSTGEGLVSPEVRSSPPLLPGKPDARDDGGEEGGAVEGLELPILPDSCSNSKPELREGALCNDVVESLSPPDVAP